MNRLSRHRYRKPDFMALVMVVAAVAVTLTLTMHLHLLADQAMVAVQGTVAAY